MFERRVQFLILKHITPRTKAPMLRECKTRYGSNQNSLGVEQRFD